MARSLGPSWAAICFLFMCVGCEHAFTPKGPYSDKAVVYCVLSNRSDTQYVRVYTTYDPPQFDPLAHTTDNVVRGADVIITGGALPSRFQEKLVPRVDTSRYHDNIAMYASYPFHLEPATTYSLSVVSLETGSVTARVTVPRKGRIQILNAYVLNGGGTESENIVVYGWIRELTYGILMRLYLIYDVLEGNVWVQHQEEMPVSMVKYDDGSEIVFYPELNRRQTSALVPDKEMNEMVVFSRAAYFERLGAIYDRNPFGAVHVKRALVILTQAERNLYTYVKVVNGFQDAYSIRTDEPDYTNIVGGHGIFGAMVEDSLSVDLNLK